MERRSKCACLRNCLVVLVVIWQMCTLLYILKLNHTPLEVTFNLSSPQLHFVVKREGINYKSEKLVNIWNKYIDDHQENSSGNVNINASNKIGLWREIPDTRPGGCGPEGPEVVSASLPPVGIVIPFHQEPLSLLLRTVQSVADRTPKHLLKELILVDDASEDLVVERVLEAYLDELPVRTRFLKNFRREGLIRSRLRGMQATKADIVVFLDANVEVNRDWLQPLLREIVMNPSSVVQPFVDGIDAQTLEYSSPPRPLFTGSFSWDLRYVWVQLPQHIERAATDFGKSYWSTTLVGCAMMVNKTHFQSIGSFDAQQEIWGGENLELSFRTWMCGGSVITVPCSRVGHVFRKPVYADETSFQNTLQKNLIRIAEVWMDGYKKYFYGSSVMYKTTSKLTSEDSISLQKRSVLRKNLNCRSFHWFLQNVAGDVIVPPRKVLLHGEIQNKASSACWEVAEDRYIVLNYLCWRHKVISKNIFTLTSDGFLMRGDSCVLATPGDPSLWLGDCPSEANSTSGIWSFVGQRHVGQIMIDRTVSGVSQKYCIEHVTSVVKTHYREQMPQLHVCDANNSFQTWTFTYRFNIT